MRIVKKFNEDDEEMYFVQQRFLRLFWVDIEYYYYLDDAKRFIEKKKGRWNLVRTL